MKKQKNILHDKCQVDFLNNRRNSQWQKQMLHNNYYRQKKIQRFCCLIDLLFMRFVV